MGKRYWGLLRQAGYNQHPLSEPTTGNVGIVKAALAEDFSLADVIEIADDERHHKCGDQVILLWKYGKEAIIKGAACLI